jgi:acetyl esterase/lipase
MVQVGKDELLLDDARRLVERAHVEGVDATLEVWPGLWHILATQAPSPSPARRCSGWGASCAATWRHPRRRNERTARDAVRRAPLSASA